jgi:hypothetical protein
MTRFIMDTIKNDSNDNCPFKYITSEITSVEEYEEYIFENVCFHTELPELSYIYDIFSNKLVFRK